MGLTAALTIPIGVSAAVYLEEYAPKNWLTSLLEVNISNLAGVPSIVYGLLGLGLFVQLMALGKTVIAGAMTLTLLVLPIVILASRGGHQGGARHIQGSSLRPRRGPVAGHKERLCCRPPLPES